jgi:hypothetical protein
MPGMDLELLSGLQNMSDDDMSGNGSNGWGQGAGWGNGMNGWGNGNGVNPMMAQLMGALMGGPQPQSFNYLAGLNQQLGAMMGAPQSFNYLAGYGYDPVEQQRQALLAQLAGTNPELAMMMGWNPFGAISDAAKWVGQKAGGLVSHIPIAGNLLRNLIPFGGAQHPHHPPPPPPPPAPMALPTPLSAVQPNMPGVPDRGGRVQPLGFENGAFTVSGPAVVTVRARPQRPLRGGRLVADFTRTGVSATGLLTLVQLVVATDGQLLSGDPISFAALSPNAFGVGVNLSPAAVGNEIFATVATSALPTGQDRIDFNLTLFGLTVG